MRICKGASDRSGLVAVIFFMLGMGTLLPWNFFITAMNYFTDRLKNGTSSTQTDTYMFGNMSVLLAQLPLLLFTLLNSFLYQQEDAHCWQHDLHINVFPAITINTKPSGLFDGKDNIFVPVCSFIVFNVMDWIGRSLTSRLQWPSMKSHSFPFFVVLRVVFIPALMLCNIQPRVYLPVFFNHDMAYIIIMSLFAMTNGYFACLSMSYAPQLVRPKDAETAGALMTFFLALGLSLGAAFSFGLKIIL
ncbi:equilibrative nucleoside transporter 2-like [Sinocyclocheilus grahami]|uniref:equilibrative nucleoside transporter 2-like n=1 Tax=Sinocyclocheilus grahami TaxID=75366 RepID=UPI0007AC7904|nr:PREDICTED: equilibrative nucleoside transporter 2-like [Sinocyclocheilus grahami]